MFKILLLSIFKHLILAGFSGGKKTDCGERGREGGVECSQRPDVFTVVLE